MKASGSRTKISLFSVATTRQLTASSSEWLFFIVSIATMTDCVCVWETEIQYHTSIHKDKRWREELCVCEMCAELHVFFGSANLSLQWYMFEYGGEGLKVVWLKLKQPAYNGTQESLWSPSCSSLALGPGYEASSGCVTHTWSLTLVSEL